MINSMEKNPNAVFVKRNFNAAMVNIELKNFSFNAAFQKEISNKVLR